jgi:hypothetical protein
MADESFYGPASIADIDGYHNDAVASLAVYFSNSGLPHFQSRFAGYQPYEVNEELSKRLTETDIRSSLTILAYLEAAFRTDYEERSKRRKRDALSREFRQLWKLKQQRVSLEEE